MFCRPFPCVRKSQPYLGDEWGTQEWTAYTVVVLLARLLPGPRTRIVPVVPEPQASALELWMKGGSSHWD